MTPLRDRIRRRTASAHQALEQTPLMRAFDGHCLSALQYRGYLDLQLQLHAPLEAALAPWLPAEWVDLRLRKSTWLRDDLRTLGGEPAVISGAFSEVRSASQALGVLYVLEGSTLGLQLVRKKLQHTQPGLHRAGRFMLGYGPDTGRHWREFLERLELLPQDTWPQAEEAAVATFGTFLNGFANAECSLT